MTTKNNKIKSSVGECLNEIVNKLKEQNKENNKPYAERLVYNLNKEKQKGGFSNSF